MDRIPEPADNQEPKGQGLGGTLWRRQEKQLTQTSFLTANARLHSTTTIPYVTTYKSFPVLSTAMTTHGLLSSHW